MPTFAFPDAPENLTILLLRRPECSPTNLFRFHGFGGVLNARLLSIPDRSTSELLRTL